MEGKCTFFWEKSNLFLDGEAMVSVLEAVRQLQTVLLADGVGDS